MVLRRVAVTAVAVSTAMGIHLADVNIVIVIVGIVGIVDVEVRTVLRVVRSTGLRVFAAVSRQKPTAVGILCTVLNLDGHLNAAIVGNSSGSIFGTGSSIFGVSIVII